MTLSKYSGLVGREVALQLRCAWFAVQYPSQFMLAETESGVQPIQTAVLRGVIRSVSDTSMVFQVQDQTTEGASVVIHISLDDIAFLSYGEKSLIVS